MKTDKQDRSYVQLLCESDNTDGQRQPGRERKEQEIEREIQAGPYISCTRGSPMKNRILSRRKRRTS